MHHSENREANRRTFMTSGLKTIGAASAAGLLLAGPRASGASVLQAATLRSKTEGVRPYSVDLGIPGIAPLTEWGVYAFLTNSTAANWSSSNEGKLIGHLTKVPINLPFTSVVGSDEKWMLDNLRDFALASPSKTVIAEFPKWHLCNKEIHEDAIRNQYRVLLFADEVLNDYLVESFAFADDGRSLESGFGPFGEKIRKVDISHIAA